MMDRQSKETGLTKEQLQEYLDKGGTITKCPPGARTEDIEYKGGFYGSKKKKEAKE
jgi:hypothetical protein